MAQPSGDDAGIEALRFVALALRLGEGVWGRSGVGKFGAEGGKITRDVVGREGARGFDGDVVTCRAERLGQIVDFLGEKGFSACQDHMAKRGAGSGFLEDGINGSLGAFGVPRCVGCIAPTAAQVATGGADEKRGGPGQGPFALDRVKCLSDVHSGEGAAARY